jgi:Fuc2NAc and GlcNAc transferase
MSMGGFGLLLLSTSAVSASLAFPLRAWLRNQQLLDLPGDRRSHEHPTPRGGGLAVVAALVAAWLLWPGGLVHWWLPMAAVLGMALVGWIEDRHGLQARWRFLAQAAVATALVVGLGELSSIRVAGTVFEGGAVLSVIGVIAAVWLINLYNFMDGSDGLAAGQGVWVGAIFFVLFAEASQPHLAALAIAGAGAWGGFLVWNRPPASLFMGDVGSLALGAFVAALALLGEATGAVSVWLSFMVSSTFIVDATLTLLRRVVRGERWYTPHRQHAYQRLLVMGWSHGRVLALYALVNVLVVSPVIAAAWRWPGADTLLAAGLAALLALGWQVVQSAATRHNDKASL